MLAWKANWLYENFGGVEWAEAKFGLYGGSRIFYKLMGILIIVVGLLAMTGLLGPVIMGTIGKLFRG